MQPGEHEVMARAEERHWWYRGLRDVVARCLARPGLVPPAGARVLDAGCGTGANLRWVQEALAPSYLGGFDVSEEALRIARAKAPGADLYVGDICAPEIRQEPLDLVLSLDVIYIPGAARARSGLLRLVEALRPGGLLVLNLPAYRWLFSEHDVAIHTSQRFTAREVRALLDGLELRVERLSYRLCLLFPLVVAGRLPGILRSRRTDAARDGRGGVRARSDLHDPPPEWLNRSLLAALRPESACIARGLRFPWGSSVFAIGRKP